MKKTIATVLLTVLLALFVTADAGHPEHSSMDQAEAIINAEIPCEQLSTEQLTSIGEYYMEEMHPGEAHEQMDNMLTEMGTLEETHINLAKNSYCQNTITTGGGMMNMMSGTMLGGMGWGFGGILWTVILVGLAILVWLWVIKLWKQTFEKKR